MNEKANMNISGSSTMPGGDYAKVSVSGCGKIIGDVKAEQMVCSGVAKIEGNATIGKLTCSGACSFQQDLTVTEKATFSGASKVLGTCKCHEMLCSGATKLEQNVSCNTLKLAGVIKVAGDVEAESVYLDGAVSIEHLLNSEEIFLKSRNTSTINEIGCSKLTVKKGRISFWNALFHPKKKVLITNSIECDSCDLEGTEATIVRGSTIVIHKGCKIERVEYTQSCTAAKGTVKEMVKI